jgi:very-short-patch-repair endonuclease
VTACPNIKEFWRQSNELPADKILAESYTRCKLRCKNGHEKDEIANRLRQAGKYECQQCDLLYNNAAVRYPHLVNEVNDGTDISKYLWASSQIVNWKCLIKDCGHTWNSSIQGRTLYGYGCAKCAGNLAYTYEAFLVKANEVHKCKYRYTKPAERFDMHIKLSIICPVELHGEFLQRGQDHLTGRGCPKCGQFSRGEVAITEFLTTKGIRFNTQERFVLLKEVGDRRFKYDFYLLDFNLVIEFDGLQHFKVTNWTNDNDKNSVLARMKKDISKEQFLLNNGISVVRIPYTAIENIPTYLDWLLSKLDPKQHNILTYGHYIGQLVNTRGTFIAYTEVKSPPIDWPNVR